MPEVFDREIRVHDIAGTGSECLVAKALGHEFLGFDLNPDFVRMSNLVVKRNVEI